MAKVLFMNPRKRRRRKARKARARRRRAAAVRTNPTRRKRRYSESKSMSTKKRRRRVRRNPIASSSLVKQILSGQLMPAGVGAAGGLVLDVAMGQISPRLPDALRKPELATAVKVGVALGLGYLAEKSGAISKSIARDATRGALTVQLYNAGRQVIAKVAPKLALAGLGEQYDDDVNLEALIHTEDEGVLGEQFDTAPVLGEQFDHAPMLNGLDVDHYRRGPGY